MCRTYRATLWHSRELAKPLEVTFTGDEAEGAATNYFTHEAPAYDAAELVSFESGDEDAVTYLRSYDKYDINLYEIEALVESDGSDYACGLTRQYSD